MPVRPRHLYGQQYPKYPYRWNCVHHENDTVTVHVEPEAEGAVAAILDQFRSFMRHAPLWQEPGILGVDVTMSQAKCLFITSLHPGISMSALAAQLKVGLSAASGLVDRLVEHGYLARREDPSDRRQQLVSLTDAGREVVDRFRRFSADRLAELLQGLSPAELEALLIGLSAIDREARALQVGATAPAPAIHERTPA